MPRTRSDRAAPSASRHADNAFNRQIVEEFRANAGHVSGGLADMPLILVHHIGAKSGIERVTPLAYTAEQDGRYLIYASNGGSPDHPSWYYNVKANPSIEVETGTETFTVRAEELHGSARAERWSKLAAASPGLANAQASTAREIPLLVLTREG
jgi:deazaflavin-dependent oxidoreductase (nitroreductase family)